MGIPPREDELVATAQRRRRRPWPFELYRSAVGKKWVMAVTGVGLIGFVIAHLVGNLKIFFPPSEGRAPLDVYGEWLREGLLVPIFPGGVALWSLRLLLALAFALHIHAAYALTRMNWRARPTDYQAPRHYVTASYASRTMRWSGVLVLLFLPFHLANFTWGIQPASPATWEHGAVFDNFIATFSRPGVTIFYVLANLALGLHLYHGIWSMFQSMGINHPRFNALRRRLAQGLALVITVGNVSMPLAVLFGFRGVGA